MSRVMFRKNTGNSYNCIILVKFFSYKGLMRDASNRKGQKKWTAQQHKGPFAIGFKQGDQLEKK